MRTSWLGLISGEVDDCALPVFMSIAAIGTPKAMAESRSERHVTD